MSYAKYVRRNYDSLKLIFLTAFVLGIAPLNLNLPQKYKSLPIIHSCVLFTWYSVQFSLNFYLFKETELSAPSFAIILQKSCENLIPILAILSAFRDKGQTPRQAIDELSFCDQCLHSVGVEIDIGKIKNHLQVFFKCAFSYIILLFIFMVIPLTDLNSINFSQAIHVLFTLSHFLYTIFFTFFICSLMYSYKCRFQCLNNAVRAMIFSGIQDGCKVVYIKPYSMDQLRSINTIKFVHSIYRDLSILVMKRYTGLITLQLFQCLTVVTLMAYMILCTILSGQLFEKVSMFSTIALLFVPTHYLVIILYPITFCLTITSQEANKMESIIHELMNETEDQELLRELENFLRELLHSRLVFTACNFFVIDYTLFTKIAGAVVSYVIIFMQFGSTDYNEFFYNLTKGKYST